MKRYPCMNGQGNRSPRSKTQQKDGVMNEDERGLVRCLLEMKRLEGKVAGIAQKALAEGEDRLSPKQRYIFDKHVRRTYFSLECEVCHCDVPLSEFARWEDERMCYGHAKEMAKAD